VPRPFAYSLCYCSGGGGISQPYFAAVVTSLSTSGGPSGGTDGSVTGSPTSSKNPSKSPDVNSTMALAFLVSVFL
jgi:hypothetical protein